MTSVRKDEDAAMLSYSADHPVGNSAVVTPPAEIDITNAEQLQEELNAVLDRGTTTVIVDMTRTTFCDSAGSRALLLAHQRASGMNTDLRVVITQQAVRRVFELLGMDEVIHVYASLAAAEGDPAENALLRPLCPAPLDARHIGSA